LAFLQDHSVIIAIGFVLSLLALLGFLKYKNGSLGGYHKSGDTTAVIEEVLKIVPFPVVLLTGQYTIIYLNPSAETLFDSQLRRSLGVPSDSLFELQNPQTKSPIKDFLDFSKSKSLANQSQSQVVNCIVRYQGALNAWMNVTVSPIENDRDPLQPQYALFLEDVATLSVMMCQQAY